MLTRLTHQIQSLPDLESDDKWQPYLQNAKIFFELMTSSVSVQDVFFREMQIQDVSFAEIQAIFANEIFPTLLALRDTVLANWKSKTGYFPPEFFVPFWIDILPSSVNALNKLRKVLGGLQQCFMTSEISSLLTNVNAACVYKPTKVDSESEVESAFKDLLEAKRNQLDKSALIDLEAEKKQITEIITKLREEPGEKKTQPSEKIFEMQKIQCQKIQIVYSFLTDQNQKRHLVAIQKLEREAEIVRAELQQFIKNDVRLGDSKLYDKFFNRAEMKTSAVMDQLAQVVNQDEKTIKNDLDKEMKIYVQKHPNFAKAVKNFARIKHFQHCVRDSKLTPTERFQLLYKEFYLAENGLENIANPAVDEVILKFNQLMKLTLQMPSVSVMTMLKNAIFSLPGYFYAPEKKQEKCDKKVEVVGNKLS